MADLVTSYTSCINDWDLEAILRGWGGGGGSPPPAWWSKPDPPPLGLELGGFDVDRLEATATVLNELEELYKPFLLQADQVGLLQHQPMCSDSPTKTPSSSSSCHLLFGSRIDQGNGVQEPSVEEKEYKRPSVADDQTQPAKASCKRRKSKQRARVVYRSGGDEDENLAEMDQWNWRKYGQKTIKGSPYPRLVNKSYYRCSSGVRCQARKQVEQSKDEPCAYSVSYMGDHSHPLPSRRRSLAGRKLTKLTR